MFRSPLADGIILLLIILLFVGPKRLPMLSRSIGESIKEFKGGVAEHQDKQIDASEAPGSTPAESTEKSNTVA
jgi:TatA/E family protein of Tat protein translocase